MLNNHPVIKRFLKGLIAVSIPVIFSYTTGFLQNNPTVLGGFTAIVAALLLAIEKSFPNNI